jgi:hypothetical protein
LFQHFFSISEGLAISSNEQEMCVQALLALEAAHDDNSLTGSTPQDGRDLEYEAVDEVAANLSQIDHDAVFPSELQTHPSIEANAIHLLDLVPIASKAAQIVTFEGQEYIAVNDGDEPFPFGDQEFSDASGSLYNPVGAGKNLKNF